MGHAPCCSKGVLRVADVETEPNQPTPEPQPSSDITQLPPSYERREQTSEPEPSRPDIHEISTEDQGRETDMEDPSGHDIPRTSTRDQEEQEPSGSSPGGHPRQVAPPSGIYHRDEAGFRRDRANNEPVVFSFSQLADATNNFALEALLGEGGFGSVYLGNLTGQAVAVKRLERGGDQGETEFLAEVLMLSIVRHPHIINMIGYCTEGLNRLIVYEFMPNGSLEFRLHEDPQRIHHPLDWDTRMKIAAGTAKALSYLHDEAKPPVIYRDLKSSNILLGQGFYPKLSDFGLASFVPRISQAPTTVMGTYGYCAPEYARTGLLTIMADVYSFGVVLLELITAERALDLDRGGGLEMLVDWTNTRLTDGGKENIADPKLRGQVPVDAICRVVDLALRCLRDDPSMRPNMPELAYTLETWSSVVTDQGRDLRQGEASSSAPPNSPRMRPNMPELAYTLETWSSVVTDQGRDLRQGEASSSAPPNRGEDDKGKRVLIEEEDDKGKGALTEEEDEDEDEDVELAAARRASLASATREPTAGHGSGVREGEGETSTAAASQSTDYHHLQGEGRITGEGRGRVPEQQGEGERSSQTTGEGRDRGFSLPNVLQTEGSGEGRVDAEAARLRRARTY